MTPIHVQEALVAVKHSSVLDWAAKFPRLSVVELAKQLSGRIAPIALQEAMVKEARERGCFPELARALMVRLLHRDFARGMGSMNVEEAQAAHASGLSVWMLIFDPDQRATAELVWNAVAKEMEKHPDWVPQHGEEPRLLKLFAGHNLSRSKRATLVARARERIETALHGQRTHQAAVDALASLPPGHGYIHAAGLVDAEVRNGGFLQYLKNSGGVELPLAIAALKAMGRSEFSLLLEEALAVAREHHRHLLAPSIFSEPKLSVTDTSRSLMQLDKAYFALPHDLFEAFASLIEAQPQLFEPPFRQLQHREDGRKWRVRLSGAAIELEIELEDGTSVTRTRQCATASRAEAEMQTMINEQLADGFVDVA